ncbi:MAG TPA: MMPL family transporter [Solirubrobacteraceae bacterium]|nr:MMPL family transporter [Solirubrobacteraceae bacterium]
MIASITRWSLAHRRIVVGAWALLAVVGILTVGQATKALSTQYSVPGREGFETNAAIARTFHTGGDTPPLVPVVTLPAGASVRSPAALRGLERMTARIERALPGARIASYASTHDRGFVSADGRTTFALVYPTPRGADAYGGNATAARRAQSAVRGLRIAGSPVRITGIDALNASGNRGSGLGLLLESVLGGGSALLVLAFVFASLLALVPLVMAVISIMTSFLMVWGLTAITPISSIVEFLIALVGLGVAIDYSLLIVMRWREERARGHEGDEAIVRAMSTAGRAVAFSGSTVAIGLLALIVLPVPFLRSVGYGGLLIPLVSVVVASTLLPVMLSVLGSRLDWPHIRSEQRASRGWIAWASLVVRRRGVAAGVAVAILAALAIAATSLQLGSADGSPNAISQRGEARVGLVQLERSGIGDGALAPIEILAPADEARGVASVARGLAGVQGALAPAAAGWERGGRAIVDVVAHTQATAAVDRVRSRVHAVGSDVRVGGIVAQNEGFISATYGSFPLMIGLIALLTFVLLARAFRSVVLPLKAVALNVLSVAAAWGVLTLVWQDGHGSRLLWGIPASGSIPSWLPVIVFAFLFGLSMDYEVFILARIREEYDATGSTDRAVVSGLARTGRLVTSAALILFLGFVSMATAPSTSVKMIATGLGAGILLDATVVRSLLVPSAVALFGRVNWWMPSGLARALRVPRPAPRPHEPQPVEMTR